MTFRARSVALFVALTTLVGESTGVRAQPDGIAALLRRLEPIVQRGDAFTFEVDYRDLHPQRPPDMSGPTPKPAKPAAPPKPAPPPPPRGSRSVCSRRSACFKRSSTSFICASLAASRAT